MHYASARSSSDRDGGSSCRQRVGMGTGRQVRDHRGCQIRDREGALDHAAPDAGDRQEHPDARPFASITDLDALLSQTIPASSARGLRRLFVHINLNTATREQILLIPTPEPDGREFKEHGPYKALAQFHREIDKYVDDKELARLEQYVFVPIDLNTASDADIQTIPGWAPDAARVQGVPAVQGDRAVPPRDRQVRDDKPRWPGWSATSPSTDADAGRAGRRRCSCTPDPSPAAARAQTPRNGWSSTSGGVRRLPRADGRGRAQPGRVREPLPDFTDCSFNARARRRLDGRRPRRRAVRGVRPSDARLWRRAAPRRDARIDHIRGRSATTRPGRAAS